MGALLFILLSAMPIAPVGRCVLDESNALSAQQYVELERICTDLDRTGDGQLAIAITDDFRDDDVDEFSSKLFHSWEIGHKGRNDGVLIVVAPKLHKWRIEVGYGLEGRITDLQAAHIGREQGVPYFKQGNTYEGIRQISMSIVALVHQEAQENPPAPAPVNAGPAVWLILLLILFGSVGLIALVAWLIVRNEERSTYVPPRYPLPRSELPLYKQTRTTRTTVVAPSRPSRRDDTPPSSSSSSWSSSDDSSSSSSSDSGFGGFGGGDSGGGGSGGDW